MHKTRMRVVVLTFTAVLLAGCGSGGSKDDPSDAFTPGGRGGTSSATPSTSAAASADAPPVDLTLPPDVKLVFDIKPTGNAVEDKILQDFANTSRAQYKAVFDNQPRGLLPHLYTADAGLVSMVDYVLSKQKSGTVVTGTKRYYKVKVSERNALAARVTYCEDETRFFGKVRTTGKVLRTVPNPKDYALVKVTVRRNAKTGIWQQIAYLPTKGARQCMSAA
jgi:uncharacterized protein YceK